MKNIAIMTALSIVCIILFSSIVGGALIVFAKESFMEDAYGYVAGTMSGVLGVMAAYFTMHVIKDRIDLDKEVEGLFKEE